MWPVFCTVTFGSHMSLYRTTTKMLQTSVVFTSSLYLYLCCIRTLIAIYFLLHALAIVDDVLVASSAHSECSLCPMQTDIQTLTSYPAASTPLATQ